MLISTIGYEGASVDDFLDTLIDAGIEHVIDIREVAQSRRPGFSKTALSNSLATIGISYTHHRKLGDPKAGRDAARAGKMDLFRSIFSEHLNLPETIDAVIALDEIARADDCVLLCYERNPKDCHRTLVCDRLKELHSYDVRHLGVRSGGANRRVSNVGAERDARAC